VTPPRPALHAEQSAPPEHPADPGRSLRSGQPPPLVLAHGFTQTGRLWGAFGATLATGRHLVRVDLPGHGGSSALRADLPVAGDLLAAAGGPSPFDLLGYSLGARIALHAALAHPSRVRRLVLIGGTAGIEDPDARARRRRRDEEMAGALERSGDLAGFLQRWLAGPMFASLRSADLGERLRNTAAGLASSLRLAGTGTQEPLWGRLPGLAVPVLVMAGAADLQFASLGDRMVRALPSAVLSLVPGAGHAAHLEQPALAARMVEQFLAG
jgi:2-succinyl-6-hydroxy-2,4-cyclohexadiene-1-carboxylate synthase